MWPPAIGTVDSLAGFGDAAAASKPALEALAVVSPSRIRSASTIAGSGGEVLDLRYPGGKGLAGLAEWICDRLPVHVWYAAPFAGHDGVFRAKAPALRSWLIDSDPDVVTWWQRLAAPGAIAVVGDGIRFVELAAEWAPPELLLYLDPPYLMETRSGKRLYKNELTPADHRRLLAAAKRCRCAVAISGYWSRMYAAALAGWWFESRPCITRGGTMRDECLWLNVEPGGGCVSVSYSDLGRDFRERHRVAKKVRRWSARIAQLPPRERDAVMRGVISATSRRRPRRI